MNITTSFSKIAFASVFALAVVCVPFAAHAQEFDFAADFGGGYNYGFDTGSYNYGYDSGGYNYGLDSGGYNYGIDTGGYNYGYDTGGYNYGYDAGGYNYGYDTSASYDTYNTGYDTYSYDTYSQPYDTYSYDTYSNAYDTYSNAYDTYSTAYDTYSYAPDTYYNDYYDTVTTYDPAYYSGGYSTYSSAYPVSIARPVSIAQPVSYYNTQNTRPINIVQPSHQVSQPININNVNNNINTNTNTNSGGGGSYPVYYPTYYSGYSGGYYPYYYNYSNYTPSYYPYNYNYYPNYNYQYTQPLSCSITASPSAISNGGTATLTWYSNGASAANLSDGIGGVAINGMLSVSPDSSRTYTLSVYNGSGQSANCQTTVTVNGQYVSLSSVPYTGFDGGVFNTLYWIGLASFALGAAYLIVYYQGGVPAFAGVIFGGRAPTPVVMRKNEDSEEIETVELEPIFSRKTVLPEVDVPVVAMTRDSIKMENGRLTIARA